MAEQIRSNGEDLSIKCSTLMSKKINQFPLSKISKLIPLKDPHEKEALISRWEMLKNIQTIGDLINLYRRSR